MKTTTNTEKILTWATKNKTLTVETAITELTYVQRQLKGMQVTLRTLKNKGLINYQYIKDARGNKIHFELA